MLSTNDLFKDLYAERWGDPDNPNAVDLPARNEVSPGRSIGWLARIMSKLLRRRGARGDAWSFIIPPWLD